MTSNQIKRPLGLQLLIYGFVLLWFILAAFPFFWTMWGSFKVELDFFSKGDWTNVFSGVRTQVVYGKSFTGAGYEGAWIQEEFWRAFSNTAIVCFFTVLTSLTIATLGGYALSRSGFRYSFWLLIIALVFRALPPITLVSGYLLPFYEWNVWGLLPTTIIVLVAINQPFTLTETLSSYDVKVNVYGGGINGQAESIRLAISRALCEINEEYRPMLKKEGLMTRDPRMVERKKFGQKKARKKFQFSKR